MKILEAYKKAKERFANLDLGHYDEFNEEIDLSTGSIKETRYDTIDITGVELTTIERVNSSMRGLESLTKKMILKDFIFRLRDSAGVEVSFLVHCYHKKTPLITANNGKHYRRFVDFYLFDNDGNIYNVCQIVLVHNKFPLRYEVRRVAYRHNKHLTTYRAGAIDRYRILSAERDVVKNHLFSEAIESIDGKWGRMAEYALYNYLFTLHEIVNCPNRFIERQDGKRRILEATNQVQSPSPKTVVPTHTVAAPAPVPPQSSDDTHAIRCPYWTVRGHYRTYKSGKKIWIEPYAKGKERGNPDYIVTKTYKIKQE